MGRDKRRKSGRDRPIPLNIDSNYKDKTSASQKKVLLLYILLLYMIIIITNVGYITVA